MRASKIRASKELKTAIGTVIGAMTQEEFLQAASDDSVAIARVAAEVKRIRFQQRALFQAERAAQVARAVASRAAIMAEYGFSLEGTV